MNCTLHFLAWLVINLEEVLSRMHTQYIAICFHYLCNTLSESSYSWQINSPDDDDNFILKELFYSAQTTVILQPANNCIFNILNASGFLLPE